MHPIQLTEQQRSNLLEMCKILFSEFQIKYFIEYDIEREAYESDYLEIHSKGKVFNCIHLFEFCMTYLFDRLDCAEEEANDLLNLKILHPIDYLYLKFLKFKL